MANLFLSRITARTIFCYFRHLGLVCLVATNTISCYAALLRSRFLYLHTAILGVLILTVPSSMDRFFYAFFNLTIPSSYLRGRQDPSYTDDFHFFRKHG